MDANSAMLLLTIIEKILKYGFNPVWNAIQNSGVKNPTPAEVRAMKIEKTFDEWFTEEK